MLPLPWRGKLKLEFGRSEGIEGAANILKEIMKKKLGGLSVLAMSPILYERKNENGFLEDLEYL